MKKILGSTIAISSLIAASAWAGPTAQLGGGSTTVVLDGGFVNALVANNIAPSNIKPGKLDLKKGTIKYNIPIGAIDLDSLAGDIFHTGGLALSNADTDVTLQNFIIDTTNGVLTGIVTLNGDVVDRIPLFDLDLGEADIQTSPSGRLRITNVGLDLTSDAASTLNAVFDLGVTGDTDVGVAAVSTRITRTSDETDDGDEED